MAFRIEEVLRAAAAMAGADGEVVELELDVLRRLASRAGMGEAALDRLIHEAKHDDEYFQTEIETVLRNPERAIVLLWRLACVDGRVSLDEQVVLHYFAGKLGVTEARVRVIVSEASGGA